MAFLHFYPALNHRGGVDLIDSLNILISIQMLKQSHPTLISDQT